MTEPSAADLGWLVGLINGEGCFYIRPHTNHGTYSCGFAIGLRSDDRCVLERAACLAGNIGNVRTSPAYKGKCAMAKWTVGQKRECWQLANLLLCMPAMPLAGAKAFQFLTWYDALIEWNKARVGGAMDWTRMAELHERLKSLRAYESTPSCMPEEVV